MLAAVITEIASLLANDSTPESVQGTIDFLNNWTHKRLLAKEGQKWCNPHDHGMLANWKVRHESVHYIACWLRESCHSISAAVGCSSVCRWEL